MYRSLLDQRSGVSDLRSRRGRFGGVGKAPRRARNFPLTLAGFAAGLVIAAALTLGVSSAAWAQAQVVCDNGLVSGDDQAGTAAGLGVTACGGGALAGPATGASAFGALATASVMDTSAFGHQSTASGTGASAFGANSLASGTGNSAFGSSSTASAQSTSAFGVDSTANSTGASAYGFNSTASSDVASAYGFNSTASGFGSSAYGSNSAAFGTASLALGRSSTAAGDTSVAVGFGATVNAGSLTSVAIGFGATVNAGSTNSVAVGTDNTVTGTNSGAFGTGNIVNGNGSFAIGDPNVINGNDSHAFGNDNTINGDNSIAIGNNNTVNHNNAAAFGNGVTTARDSQQAFGTASNTYTMAGITSAASKAAQSGPLEVVTTDASGNLASASFDSLAAGSRLATQVNRNSQRIGENTEGVAMALAMAGSFYLPDGKSFGIGGSYGAFEGGNALGFGATGRISRNAYLSAGIGMGLNEGTVGGRAGILFAW